MEIAAEGPCAGHRCDGCERCLAGECCGADVVDANLPVEGSWPGPWYGAVGEVWTTPAGKLICACCGAAYDDLNHHVRRHGLTADEYRAMWGLACGRSLVSEERRAELREVGEAGLANLRPGETGQLTSEQRSRVAYEREQRAEVRAKRKQQLDSDHQRAANAGLQRKMAEDPAFRAAIAAKRSKAMILARRRKKW